MTQPPTLQQRVLSPTPKFFKKIRNIGLVLAAVSATILAAPVALPAVVVQAAGYLAVAGSVASAVSQTTTGGWDKSRKEEHKVRTRKTKKDG
jgi:hypothetical protein